MTHPKHVHQISRRLLVKSAAAGGLSATLQSRWADTAASRQTPGPELTQSGNTDVHMYPSPGSVVVSPYTEISLRGVDPGNPPNIVASGSESGGHTGVIIGHSDGLGVSFVPDVPFIPGEDVLVDPGVAVAGSGRGAVQLRVAERGAVPPGKEALEADGPDTPSHHFVSRPDLRPPRIDVSVSTDEADDGYLFVGAKIPGGQHGALIFDGTGEPIWFAPPSHPGAQHNDVRVQRWNGDPVLTMWEGISESGYGLGHYVIRDQSYRIVASVRAGNGFPGADLHEFLLTPRGTALIIVYHPVRWNLSAMRGAVNATVVDGIVQEVEVETGRVLFEWHSLDHIAPEESYTSPPESPDERFDYLHINSIEETPDGDLVISARNTSAIYRIERDLGTISWRLGGRNSDFVLEPGVSFFVQHDARIRNDGSLTLLDNAASSDDEQEAVSRGLVVQLDEEAMVASLQQAYRHPDAIHAATQANMQTLSNGNVLIGWGSAPTITEFSADGDVVFDARLPDGGSSYRAFRMPWSGTPVDPPDLAVEASEGGRITAFASWNGATDVASWRLLAGPTPQSLEPLGEVDRTGFETQLPVDRTTGWVAVEALDKGGEVLRRSDAFEIQP